MGSPSQINIHINGGVFAQFVTLRRIAVPKTENIMDLGDRNVLSLVRLQVFVPKSSPAQSPVPHPVDIARIGFVEDDGQSFDSPIRETAAAVDLNLVAKNAKPNLIIFLQHYFWQNQFTSGVCDRRSRVHGEWAVRLQYALMDFCSFYSKNGFS